MKRPAFTMIETIIVLVIVTLIIGITLPSIGRSQKLAAEQQFWKSMHQEWHQAQLRAEINHLPTTINYDPLDRDINFSWSSEAYCDHVHVPATLIVVKFDQIEMSETGYSRARTQEFRSRFSGRTYLMKVQLAWGGFRVEEKKEDGVCDGG